MQGTRVSSYTPTLPIPERIEWGLVAFGVVPAIIEKGYRNKLITEDQIAGNKEKSKTRVRVEHIFAFIKNTMNGSAIRGIGIERALTNIGLMSLTYNICRKIQLCRV